MKALKPNTKQKTEASPGEGGLKSVMTCGPNQTAGAEASGGWVRPQAKGAQLPEAASLLSSPAGRAFSQLWVIKYPSCKAWPAHGGIHSLQRSAGLFTWRIQNTYPCPGDGRQCLLTVQWADLTKLTQTCHVVNMQLLQDQPLRRQSLQK